MAENHHTTARIMADKERIMLLEEQLAEMSDRMAEYERERMLRDVAEEYVIQAKAYEIALKMAREMAEAEREKMRKEAEKRVEREVSERLQEKKDELKRQAEAIEYDRKILSEESVQLARKIQEFETAKSALKANIDARIKESEEKRRVEYEYRLAQARKEISAEVHEQLGKCLNKAMEHLSRACETMGKDVQAYNESISSFVEEASKIESTAISDLSGTLSEIGEKATNRDRFLHKLCRTLFGKKGERKYPEDKLSSLLDAFIESPDDLRLSEAEEKKFKEIRQLIKEYTARKSALKLLQDQNREKGEKARLRHAHHTQLTAGVPVLPDIEVIYPPEYYASPESYVEIVPEGGREHHDEIVPIPNKYAIRRTEYPRVVLKSALDAKPIQAGRKIRPIDDSCSSPELLSQIETGKYVWKLPFSRQAQKFLTEGLPINRSTIDSWHDYICDILEPLYKEHEKDFFERTRILCADGSPMRIVNNEKHKTDHYYMLNFFSQDCKLSLFEMSLRKADDNPEKLAGNGRGAEDIRLFLTQWKHPVALMADGYAAYDSIAKELGADRCSCNAHSRRKFDESESENRTASLMAQSFYANIGISEKLIEEEGLTGKAKTARRKELEGPIWKAFVAWALSEHAKAADGSAIKDALNYFLERKKQLQMYMKHPQMPFTNNDCERQIREMVVGRLCCAAHNLPYVGKPVMLAYSTKP